MLSPHGALVLVLDGAHVQLLRNRRTGTAPDLGAVSDDRLHHGAIRLDGQESNVRARKVLEAIDPLLTAGSPLILVAPPDLQGALRAELPARVRRQVIAEIGKDLAGCTPYAPTERLHRARA